MRNTVSSAEFLDPSPCNCKNIRQAHLQAALAQGSYDDHKALYAAALAIKKNDPKARITGREDENGSKYCCGTCASGFRLAVQSQAAPATVTTHMIPIAIVRDSAPEPKFPKDSCYTCPKVAAGLCTPAQPLACGS